MFLFSSFGDALSHTSFFSPPHPPCIYPSPPLALAVTAVRATAATATKPVDTATASSEYAKEMEVATDAVRMASTLCQEVQGQLMRQDEQAVTKDDKSLVTLADYAAQVGERGAYDETRQTRDENPAHTHTLTHATSS